MKAWTLLLLAIMLVWNVDVSKAKDEDKDDSTESGGKETSDDKTLKEYIKSVWKKVKSKISEKYETVKDFGKEVLKGIMKKAEEYLDKLSKGKEANSTSSRR